MSAKSKIRVLVVDDSAVMRKILSELLGLSPEIEVVGTAADPYIAREKIVKLDPDVITLDIEMPRMDGITFLEQVMKHRPIRALVISSLSQAGSETALRALAAGAIDVMAKPKIDMAAGLQAMAAEVIVRVKAVATARLVPPRVIVRDTTPVPAARPRAMAATTHQVLAFAASTGGTEALKAVLSQLPADVPGTVIVQHMPPVFTKTFAAALTKLCRFSVKEAEDGDRVLPGQALLAPGNFHMELVRNGAFYEVKLHQQPLLHGVRPAADYLLKSVAGTAGANAIGVILTGMGRDGAEGLLAMRQAGAKTIGQDEATCVVYGMPKVAAQMGAVAKVLPLEQIAAAVAAGFR